MSQVISLLVTLMKIFSAIIGQERLATVLASARYWYRNHTDPQLRQKVDEEYIRYLLSWEDAKNHRELDWR